MQHLLTCMIFFFSVLLAGGASFAGNEYPATFQSGRFVISTMEQFEQRNEELHPTLEITKNYVDSVSYKDTDYEGMKIHAEGVEKGSKVIQTITYIKLVPGLWKLVFVENSICIKSSILENGVMVKKWFCDEDSFPIKGFHDLFIVTDENVDLQLVQEAFKEPIRPYTSEAEEEKANGLLSLADLEKLLLSMGSKITVSESEYQPHLKPEAEPQPALQLHIEGTIAENKRVDQTFLYVIEGDKLKLKEIDGVICWFAEALDKEICDPVYVPTPASPLPLELLNHYELTGATPVTEMAPEPENIPEGRQCGPLQTHLSRILKVHFQRSLFDVSNPIEFERFIKKFPDTADPLGLLLSPQEKQNLLASFQSQPNYKEKLSDLIEQFKAGRRGDCGWLLQFMETLKSEVLQKSSQAFQLLNKIESQGYSIDAFNEAYLSHTQMQILAKVNQVLPVNLIEMNKPQAVDIALLRVKTYIERTLNRISDLEYFTVSAMAQQDAYSTMIPVAGDLAGTLHGHQEKKYFGLSIETGYSGRHYIVRLHPAAQAQGLNLGDEIVHINGQQADQMSYKEVDAILLETQKDIQLILRRGSNEESITLKATQLNPLSFYYDVSIARENGKILLNIQMRSFEPGIAEAIYQDVQHLLQTTEVDVYVLDLRDNPGGNTDEAVNILSLFAKNRIVAFSKLGARNFSPLKEYEAKPEFFIDDEKPLIVKVNGRTMSSSEIVASGYQSLRRSVTVGEPTYGKLVGQFYIPISLKDKSNYGLLLTAFEFFNVKGKALNGIGVTPDVRIGESSNLPFDGGVGFGEDLKPTDLSKVLLYNFTVDEVLGLGLSL